MQFYNSMSKNLETLPQKLSLNIYSCGPTVYDYAHIGNFRTFLFEDLLLRTLKHNGYQINHTRNITDVDDKTIKHSQEQNISLKEFTEKFTQAFFYDLEHLRFDQSSTTYLKATDYINHMIAMIEELIKLDYAYETSDGVYFKTSHFDNYGNFAGLNLENIQQGASGSDSDYTKDDFGDFVMWKKHKDSDGQVAWDSPWGLGRPGWHTECAAMVQHQYPQGLDIHTGGIDLLFPHHTNEKAHCECMSHSNMSQMWLHATHLLVENKKMSKSLGNFYTVRDLVTKGFSYPSIRFYLQTAGHYRTPLNFTLEGLKGANTALQRINNFIHDISNNSHETTKSTLKEKFNSFLLNDLNISGAMGEIYSLINDYYQGTKIDTTSTLEDLQYINNILAVLEFSEENVLNEITQDLFNQRVQARNNKDWAESDRLRDLLLEHGIEVRDSKEGTVIKKI